MPCHMLDWIAGQPWCDGTTGMWGISYSGSSALAAASLRPPSLKAIVPLHGTANEYWGFLRPHGCRPAWWTESSWGPMMILLSIMPPLSRDPARRWARVWRERLDRLEPPPYAWHRTPYDDYMAWRTDASKVEAAMYCVSGWHDYYPQATFDYFNAAQGPKRILIGAWKHEFPDLAVRGGVDHVEQMDRWWDRWLKGIGNGIEHEPPVLVWHQSAERWRGEQAWPPAHSTMEEWHLAPGRRLQRDVPPVGGAERFAVDPTVGMHLLPFDPQTPVTPMPWDRSDDDHRCLAIDSDPMEHDIDIVGSPDMTMTVAADQTGFPLHVALCDVSPDGHSMLICQGWVATDRLNGGPLVPGEAREVTVQLYATSYRLAAGHRLRLTVAGADFPLLWPAGRNPVITVGHGARLRLPVGRIDPAEPPVTCLPPPAHHALGGKVTESAVNRVSRDLTGETATFTQLEDSSQALDDGTVVVMRRHNWSTVASSRPEDTVLTARMEADIQRDADPVRCLVETVQTVDSYHVDARIELAGRPYWHRSWDLAIGGR